MGRLIDEYGFSAFIVALVLGAVLFGYMAAVEQSRWLDACEADGNPRYTCEERWAKAHPPAPQTTVIHSVH